MSNTKPVHAHEFEKAGVARWSARAKDGLLLVTDEASGEEVQSAAYTLAGDGVRFALPGEAGLRHLAPDAPGYEAFKKVVEKLSNGPSEASEAPKSRAKTGSEGASAT